MLAADRDALLCDLAEVYHVYDLRALPVKTLAALSVGLRDDSRIKMKMAGMRYISPQVLLASIADQLTIIRFGLFAKEGTKPPPFYTDMIFPKDAAGEQTNTKAFESALGEIFARVDASLEVSADG